MNMQTLTRRSFAAGLSMTAGVVPVASAALAHPACTEVDIAAQRCRDTRRALDKAIEAYERALPPPHFTLDLTDHSRRRAYFAALERRLFDGNAPKRMLNRFGIPAERYVATTETIEQDLRRCAGPDRRRRRLLYRMRRRAKARAAKIVTLEASFGLEELQRRVDEAERAIERLAQELFAAPATNMETVLAQAKALSAYTATMDEQSYATFQAGRFGKVLADGLQSIARAA